MIYQQLMQALFKKDLTHLGCQAPFLPEFTQKMKKNRDFVEKGQITDLPNEKNLLILYNYDILLLVKYYFSRQKGRQAIF